MPISKAYLANEIFATTISKQPEQEKPESFVHQLKRNGYYTVGIGKISHSADGRVYGYKEPVSQVFELPYSWNEMLFDAGKWKTGWNAFFGYADGENRQSLNAQCKPYEKGKVDDMGYPDGLTSELAIKELRELAAKKQPFFLGVGFFKPHLPFTAPEKYWDMYDEKDIQLTPAPNIPENINLASLHESPEFNGYKLGDEKASLAKPVSDAYARKLRHAYYASVSYSDAQIGKVLAELKRLGLDKNTIVVIWGDNGWHLGDDRVWGKHTLFEFALRTPLIIYAPGMKMNESKNTSIVSTVDLYPTILDLCGVKLPFKLVGNSLVPLLNGKPKNGEEIAYGYFNNGITLRTPRYRFTKYFRFKQPVFELYDHQSDPYETKNIAEQHPEIVSKMLVLLKKGDTGLYNSNKAAGENVKEAVNN